MANEIAVGNTYTWLLNIGGTNAKVVTGQYLRFEVIGGATFITVKTQDKDGKVMLYRSNSVHLFGFEEHFDEEKKVESEKKVEVEKKEPEKPAVVAAPEVKQDKVLFSAAKEDEDTRVTPPVSLKADGTPAKKRGRPAKNPNAVQAVAKPAVPPTPPHIPTPSVVEDVEEIDEEAKAPPEKEVKAAEPPKEPEIKKIEVDDDKDEGPSVVALPSEDEDEVVPARVPGNGVPKRPVSSLARASRIPDETDGDL